MTTDGAGVAVFSGVPLGILQATASEANVYGIANGEASAPTLALSLVLGNGITLSTSLDGGDGFRYDVQSGGSLSDGGTVSRQYNDAYDGMYAVRVNNVSFSGVNAARGELTGRQLVLGPAPAGSLTITRKIYVPSEGGFARYLEIVTNPTGAAQKARVRVDGNLGSDSSTSIFVRPETTGNTYAVTFENYSGSSDPSLAHVFAGAGAVAAPVSSLSFTQGNDRRTTVADHDPGERHGNLHGFAVQRAPTDRDGADAQAVSIVTSRMNALNG